MSESYEWTQVRNICVPENCVSSQDLCVVEIYKSLICLQ